MTSYHRQRRINPPPYTRQQIVQFAEELSKRYARSVDPEVALLGISFDAVYEQIIYPEYEIVLVEDQDLGFDDGGEKILGEYDPSSNTAYIDVSLHPSMKDPRRTFTCWHEVGGHGVLQGRWLRNELRRVRDALRVVTTEESLDLATTNALERQANLFAAHAGAPNWLLWYVIEQTYNLTRPIRYIGPGKYCLDVRNHCVYYNVEDFNHLCRIIASHIQFRFGWMSVEALSYRIEQLPLVVDVTKRSFRLQRRASFTPQLAFPPSIVSSLAAATS